MESGKLDRTVLAVDDEPVVLKLVSTFVRNIGLRVLEAASASRALEICDANPLGIHLLVTDVHMPLMNGLQLAQEVRSRLPGVSVLYITGYAPNEERITAELREGKADFLAKPFTGSHFTQKVLELLGIG